MERSAESNEIKIRKFLENADKAFESRRWVAVASNLTNALNIDPKNTEIQAFIDKMEKNAREGNLSTEALEDFNNMLAGIRRVNTLVRDRGIAEEGTFTKVREKGGKGGAGGIIAGYEAMEKVSDHKFMIKTFSKEIDPTDFDSKTNREDSVYELVASDFYGLAGI